MEPAPVTVRVLPVWPLFGLPAPPPVQKLPPTLIVAPPLMTMLFPAAAVLPRVNWPPITKAEPAPFTVSPPPPLMKVLPLTELLPVKVCIPVPAFVKAPVVMIRPAKLVEVLSPPVVRVPPVARRFPPSAPPPVSEPMATLFA